MRKLLVCLRKPIQDMETWYEAAKKYPREGASVSIILTHLSFGPDYPYHISRLLKPHIGRLVDKGKNYRGLRSLCHPNLISEFMKEIALDGFIVLDESIVSKNKRDYYKLNPSILNNPIKPSSNFTPRKVISDRSIQELLQAMHSDRPKRYTYYRYKIHRINFATFLKVLQESALRHNLDGIAKDLNWYIYQTLSREELTLTECRIKFMKEMCNRELRSRERTSRTKISKTKDQT